MPVFSVTSIIDGDTFAVSPEWKWNGETGTRVRPAGYNAPDLHTAKEQKCQSLSMGSRLNSGPLTKWIGADWSATCLSGAETLPSFSPSIENCMKLKPAN